MNDVMEEWKGRGWIVELDAKARFSENGAHARVVADLLAAAGIEARVDDRWVSTGDDGFGVLFFARLEDNNLVLVQPMGSKRSAQPDLALLLGAARQVAQTAGSSWRFVGFESEAGASLAALPAATYEGLQAQGRAFSEPTGEGPRPVKPSESKRFREI